MERHPCPTLQKHPEPSVPPQHTQTCNCQSKQPQALPLPCAHKLACICIRIHSFSRPTWLSPQMAFSHSPLPVSLTFPLLILVQTLIRARTLFIPNLYWCKLHVCMHDWMRAKACLVWVCKWWNLNNKWIRKQTNIGLIGVLYTAIHPSKNRSTVCFFILWQNL